MPTLFQINVTVNSGSTGRIAEAIGETVMSYGWRSVIAYGRKAMPSRSETIRIGGLWDIYCNLISTRLFDRHGLGARRATQKLIDQIKIVDPDIVHLHNIHGYYINIGILFDFLSRSNIPIVWTLHDCWSFTGHCSHFMFAGCDRWKMLCFDCPQKRKYPASLFMDRSKQNYIDKRRSFQSISNMTIVPVSDWLAGLLKESFLSKYRIHRIHNGIDLVSFAPANVNYNEKKIILGVASVWGSRKGLDDFIQIRKMLPLDQYVIKLVGVDRAIISRLPEGIVGIERTESIDQLAQLYSEAAVFLNPTWEDNFPTTNLEALACGTPVVTYRTGGSVEAISEETGVVVNQGDHEGLVRAIKQITRMNKRELSLACRRRAEELYNKDVCFEEYFELFEGLIKPEIKNEAE